MVLLGATWVRQRVEQIDSEPRNVASNFMIVDAVFEDLSQSSMYWYRNKNTGVPELAWCWKEGGQKVYCGYSKAEKCHSFID